jgi:putative PIN family toxin of toxin-antitoxin system
VSNTIEKVIYDCNIHLQFLLNPAGPGGRCVRAALARDVELILSYYLLDELREMPGRPTPRKLGLTPGGVENYIAELLLVCPLVSHVPMVYEHPIDRDDSHYVNLAIATGAKVIVSRDRHLLGLMDPSKTWSAEFRQRFPEIHVLAAEVFLERLKIRGS